MPYTYRKQGSKYCVYKKDGGDKVGCTAGNKTALKRYLTALHMHESLTELYASGVRKITSEDLRAWFGKGGKGGVGGGGWDRYNSSGDRIGKCGDAKEGDAYAACLSKEKARKLGKAGRAAFVKRKRAAQSKGGDAKKGGERSKGQDPIKVKTGTSEAIVGDRIACDNCDHSWPIVSGGKHPYLCHKCGHDNTPNEPLKEMDPIKVKTGINEIGEGNLTPYKYSVNFEEDDEIEYKFKTKSNLTYEVSIVQRRATSGPKDSNRLIVAFKTTAGSYEDITNAGEQFKIMATVIAITKEYSAKIPNVTEISFTPAKSGEHDERRAKFYKAYINKQLPGSKIHVYSDGRYIVELPKKKNKLKEIDYHSKLSRAHKPDWYQLHSSDFKPFDENLDPDTFKDTGKSSPYGSGYKQLEERLNLFLEKNIPTDAGKWSYYKGQAKKKFDVYPSAYANAWAAKMYKKAGGGWRKEK